jgi:hypothetical protein
MGHLFMKSECQADARIGLRQSSFPPERNRLASPRCNRPGAHTLGSQSGVLWFSRVAFSSRRSPACGSATHRPRTYPRRNTPDGARSCRRDERGSGPVRPRWLCKDHWRAAAVALARDLSRGRADLITSSWWKEGRGHRVLVDFKQNAPHKTMFGTWSVRANPRAQVSTPFDWEAFEIP